MRRGNILWLFIFLQFFLAGSLFPVVTAVTGESVPGNETNISAEYQISATTEGSSSVLPSQPVGTAGTVADPPPSGASTTSTGAPDTSLTEVNIREEEEPVPLPSASSGEDLVVTYSLPALGYETQITALSADQVRPSIDGSRLVWFDKRSGNFDLYLYDLSTGLEKVIATNPGSELDSLPAIDGNRIVWEDKRNGNSDIYLYDLATGRETQISTRATVQWFPDIAGTTIVWEDARDIETNSYDIYLYDLATGEERPVCTMPLSQYFPAISDNAIVWNDKRNGNSDVYLLDLDTGREQPICVNTGWDDHPDISADRIVWDNNRYGTMDIFLYDLAVSQEFAVCTASGTQWHPAISGDRIVWQDDRNGNYDIYLYDISTAQELSICTAPGDQTFPSIDGNRIVWQDQRNGNSDIYLFTIDDSSAPILRLVSSGSTTVAGSETEYALILDQAPLGLSGYDLSVSITDPNIAEITGVRFPDWTPLSGSSGVPSDRVSVKAVDLYSEIEAGAGAVPLCYFTVRGDAEGSSSITISVRQMDDDSGNGIAPEIINGLILVYIPRIDADFAVDTTEGTSPLTVQFTDHSSGYPTSWTWNFGDGMLSSEQNPVHVYADAGTYTVSLTAGNAYENDVRTVENLIEVWDPVISLVIPFPDCAENPLDLDDDGFCEDINGNLRLDFNDVVIYYHHLSWIDQNEPVAVFDFNANGRIDFNDVVLLYHKI
jgi:TolB protein